MEVDLLPDQPLWEKLVKKWFWLYFFAYLAAPCGYFIKLIISNTLSVGDVWVLYSIIGFITILSAYNGMGLTESLNYFLPRFYLKKQWDYIKTSIRMSLWAQIITSIAIILFLFYGADRFAVHYFHSPDAVQILKYFCFYFLWVNIFQVIIGICNAFQDTFNAKFLEFIQFASILTFTILFFVFWIGDIHTYSITWILGLFIWLILGIIIFIKKYRKIVFQWNITRKSSFLKKYRNYSLWTFLSLNVVLILNQIDQQMVIVLLGPDAAWYYTNFVSLRQILILIITPIMVLIFPMLTEMIEKKQNIAIQSLQQFLYTYLSFFTIGLSIFLIVLWPEIATIFFGEKFLYSGQLMMFGWRFLIFNILFYLNFQTLWAMGKVKEKAKIIWIAVLVNFVLNLILLKLIGLRWIIMSTAIAMSIIYFWSYNIIKKTYPITVDRRFLGKNIALFLVLAGGIYYIKDSIFVLENTHRYINIRYLVLVWIIYYGIIIWINYKKVRILKKFILKKFILKSKKMN